MNQDKIIQRAIGTAKQLRRMADGQGVFATGNISGRAAMKDGARAIEALLGVLGERADDLPQRATVTAGGITIVKPWDYSGWVKGTMTGEVAGTPQKYSFAAKVYGAPSERYGINGGHVSKLAIYREEPVRRCVLNYDRCWDIEPVDPADRAVFQAVMDYLEAMALQGEEAP